jgi:hypothetical protein
MPHPFTFVTYIIAHRPAPVTLTEPTGASMALQGHAELVRPHLHAELRAEVLADLCCRDIIAKRLDRTQRCLAQRHCWFCRCFASAATG